MWVIQGVYRSRCVSFKMLHSIDWVHCVHSKGILKTVEKDDAVLFVCRHIGEIVSGVMVGMLA